MSILVTGGAGYIGSHTVVELLEKSEDIVILDNLQQGHENAVMGGNFYKADLRDEEALDKIFTENDIEAVIHFAADALVGESIGDPLKYYNNNVVSTLNLLTKMKQYGVYNIVFSSTAATYGSPETIPILENHIQNPINPYGETKLAVEKALKWANNAYGIKHIVLRYFNAAGAHISGKIGEDHFPETHIIPLVLQVAQGKRQTVSIYGDDYETSDGSCIRDYVHVTDLADAHILALNRLRSGQPGGMYNLGYGKGFSVKEVINIAKDITGVDIKTNVVERRPGDPAVLIASSEKVRKELKWQPRYSDLRIIIQTAWKWHTSYPDGYCRG